MSDATLQQIMAKLDTRMKTILTTAGYSANLGSHVYQWLDRDLDAAELPALDYRDLSAEISPSTNRLKMTTVTVEIRVHAESAALTPQALRNMVQDVFTAIGTDDRWGTLAFDTQPQGVIFSLDYDSDKIKGEATIRIAIQYENAKWSF